MHSEPYYIRREELKGLLFGVVYMDDEDEKKDGEDVGLADGVLDDALGIDETDDPEEVDPLSLADPFGGDENFDGKQWE